MRVNVRLLSNGSLGLANTTVQVAWKVWMFLSRVRVYYQERNERTMPSKVERSAVLAEGGDLLLFNPESV